MTKTISAILLGAFLLAAPAAYADGVRDDIIRTEAQIGALNSADASAAAPGNYKEAQLRLSEARMAQERNREDESQWRSAEAALQAEIVQEKIKLRGLERTVSENETGIATLRRELNS